MILPAATAERRSSTNRSTWVHDDDGDGGGYGDDGDYFSKLPLAPPTCSGLFRIIFLNYLAPPTYSGFFMISI